MKTANLKLCKKLYELSGWSDTFAWYEWQYAEPVLARLKEITEGN